MRVESLGIISTGIYYHRSAKYEHEKARWADHPERNKIGKGSERKEAKEKLMCFRYHTERKGSRRMIKAGRCSSSKR